MESILTSIKKLLGIGEDYDHFDTDIVIHINTAFMTLTQLGVGPSKGFTIKDKSVVWTDFIPADDLRFEGVKTFIYLKVKLVFDPPSSSAVLEAYNRTLDELTSRLNYAAETSTETDEEENQNVAV